MWEDEKLAENSIVGKTGSSGLALLIKLSRRIISCIFEVSCWYYLCIFYFSFFLIFNFKQ